MVRNLSFPVPHTHQKSCSCSEKALRATGKVKVGSFPKTCWKLLERQSEQQNVGRGKSRCGKIMRPHGSVRGGLKKRRPKAGSKKMSAGIWYSRKTEEELQQKSPCIKYFSTLLEGCSPYGLCLQYHYHWLRLTLEILAALHSPGDSEIQIGVLQLKLLSSDEAKKITGRCLVL